jgi:hypothetical protein
VGPTAADRIGRRPLSQTCLTWDVEKARKLGIDDENIRAAIETGHMVEKGAMYHEKVFSFRCGFFIVNWQRLLK